MLYPKLFFQDSRATARLFYYCDVLYYMILFLTYPFSAKLLFTI